MTENIGKFKRDHVEVSNDGFAANVTAFNLAINLVMSRNACLYLSYQLKCFFYRFEMTGQDTLWIFSLFQRIIRAILSASTSRMELSWTGMSGVTSFRSKIGKPINSFN